jgi:thymidylate synthase
MNQGNIPVINVQGRTLPEVWEKSLLELWEKGMLIPTQYDKPQDPASRDCTAILTVEEPFAEPRIHRSFPAGLEQLEIYRQEVVDGVHDYWIKPEEGKWTYTYHKRLFDYQPSSREGRGVIPYKTHNEGSPVVGEAETLNQIQFIIDGLAGVPYSRRCFGVTYMPSYDQGTEDPPCLQRVWCRCGNDNEGNLVLNMNTHWRSRDAFKAAFMNIFALTDLQRYIAEGISQKIGKVVKIGRYVDISDSYHIYGSYFNDFERFLDSVKNRKFEDRVWNSQDELIQSAFEDGRGILKREGETGKIGMAR